MIRSRSTTLLAALLVLGSALAGCVGDEGLEDEQAGGLSLSSFEDALANEGETFQPTGGDSTVRLKLLQPATTVGLETGEQPIVLLLYDSSTQSPVTDASFEIEARMPAMGHGTSPEQAPEHVAHGVYEGMTTWSMPGTWALNLDPQLADGTVLEFDVEVQVGGDGTMDEGMGGMPMGPPVHDSYQMAKDAPGDVFQPDVVEPRTDLVTLEGIFMGLHEDGAEVPVTASATKVVLAGEFEPQTPLAELNVSLHAPDGTILQRLILNADTPNGSVEVADLPATGTFTVNATGHALNASYVVNAEVVHAAPNLDLKLLHPREPGNAPVGELPILLLLFDADADAPLSDADVSLKAMMPAMGHGTSGEEDPVHEQQGQYLGKTNLSMEGEWVLHVTVDHQDDHRYTFLIPLQAGGGGSMDGGHDHGEHDHGDHDH